jgi:hypothetical protein
MVQARKGKGSVAIDTVPLPEKVLGMKTKKGVISQAGDQYYFKADGQKSEIPVVIIPRKDIRKLVGKEVYAAFSLKKPGEIVAIGTWPTPEARSIKCYWIICYIPATDMIQRIEPLIREALFDSMRDEGIITSKLENIIKNGIKL